VSTKYISTELGDAPLGAPLLPYLPDPPFLTCLILRLSSAITGASLDALNQTAASTSTPPCRGRAS